MPRVSCKKMQRYSYKKNNSYESGESSGSSVGSDQDKSEMDQYGNQMNMYHQDLNRSREEQRTYMNPILNVPSYAPDRYGYRPTQTHHMYHPIVVPQIPVYPRYDQNMYQSNYYQPQAHHQNYNYRGGRGNVSSSYCHQSYNRSPYENRRTYNNHQRNANQQRSNYNNYHNYQNNHYRNNSRSYEHQQPSPAEPARPLLDMNIQKCSPLNPKTLENIQSPDVFSDDSNHSKQSSTISNQNYKFGDSLVGSQELENYEGNQTIESSNATFESSDCNGTLETSDMQSTTMESSVLEISCANQTFENSRNLERSINQSIEHPPVYEVFQVPIFGPAQKTWVNPANQSIQSESDTSLANQSLEVEVADETVSDFSKTDISIADDSIVKPENESCETADDSGVRAENESSEMMDESEIRPEHESSGIVEDVVSGSCLEKPKIENEISINPELSYQLEDSCNAVDHNISRSVSNDFISDLSFNGKISSLNNQEPSFIVKSSSTENFVNLENDSESKQIEEETEEEKLRNESFEALKKEDSSMMIYLNEKSPDLFDASDLTLQEEEASDSEPAKDVEEPTKISDTSMRQKLVDCDKKILNKLKNTLSGICPPPSITRLKLTMEQMLNLYKENLGKTADPIADFRTEERDSFFKPTHCGDELERMEWPEHFYTKCHDVYYNRNNNCEAIEKLLLKFGERYVGYETTSSMNASKSPSSSRKRAEKFKLLTQSPGSRLSHLAKRRTIFSSANLKSKLLNTSQTSIKPAPSSARQILVDKRRLPLMQKTSKASPRRKTPGNRKKTPKSAKKRLEKSGSKPSKRALFTSPAHPKESAPIAGPSKPTQQSYKRALFSPVNSKRKRSDSIDSNDSFISGNLLKPTKVARIENSPNKLMKSYSFSVAGTANIDSCSLSRRGTIVRTQSEQLCGTNASFRQPLTEEHKRKLLWAASSALNNKQISKDHDKFKEYATLLVRLTKRVFIEFYDPLIKSMSTQMLKFANSMVFYVIQGRSYDDIYTLTKEKYQKTKNVARVSGYIHAQEEYERSRNLVRRSSSQLFRASLMNSSSSLNISNYSSSENLADLNVASRKSSISENSSSASKSDTLTRSSSKNNDGVGVLRENLLRNISDQKNSGHRASESDVSKIFVGKTNSNMLQKAKRQISF